MRTTKISKRTLSATFVACLIGAASAAYAQQPVSVVPTKGQSPEQVQKDQAECQSIAQQSAPAPEAQKRGGALKGAAAGAAVGAGGANRRGGDAYDHASDRAQDAYREDQAQKGAAAGAVAGAARQRRDNKQATASQGQAVDSAYRSCLMGRGYQVK